jgi:hypothetical protein
MATYGMGSLAYILTIDGCHDMEEPPIIIHDISGMRWGQRLRQCVQEPQALPRPGQADHSSQGCQFCSRGCPGTINQQLIPFWNGTIQVVHDE